MIGVASEEHNVDPYVIASILKQEGNFGASPVSIKNNNPGGTTWNENFPDSMKGTARPESEGGFYVKFKTMQDGVNYVAENINKLNTPTDTPTDSPEEETMFTEGITGKKEQDSFDKEVQSQLEYLNKNKGKKKKAGEQSFWGIAFETVKNAYPNVSNEEIDKLLQKDKFYDQKYTKDEEEESEDDAVDKMINDAIEKESKKKSWVKKVTNWWSK